MILNQQSVVLNSRLQSALATWALKTVLLMELALKQMYPSARKTSGYSASEVELAWLASHHSPPPRSRVWLGAYDAERQKAVGHITNSLASKAEGSGLVVPCHLTTVHVGYVAFQVFTVDFVVAESVGLKEFQVAPPPELADHLLSLWPQVRLSQQWPPKFYFTDEQWSEVSTWNGRFQPAP